MNALLLQLESERVWNGIILVDHKNAKLLDDYTFEELIRFLPLKLHAKILNKKTVNGRTATLANSLLQIFGCMVASKIPIDNLAFKRGTFGKPFLENDLGISFSMSNSQNYVVQYLVKRIHEKMEVGIDIASKHDYIDENDLEMFKEIFSTAEYENLTSYSRKDEKESMFAYYWSLKESYTKLTGIGLNCDLSKIDLGKLQKLDAPTCIQKTMENELVTFYSQWIEPEKVEVISICYYSGQISPELSSDLPKVCKISFEELAQFFSSIQKTTSRIRAQETHQ